jgi:lipid II:glycine glycyltransferase (peptidoglycan interpeptide bridge formation enzyme)
MNYQCRTDLSTEQWDTFVGAHPDAHLLQTSDWGKQQSGAGWSVVRVAVIDSAQASQAIGGAQVLFHTLPLRLGTRAYLPAGPLFASDDPAHPANRRLWEGIHTAARQRAAMFLKVEPCNWYRPRPDLPAQLVAAGLRLTAQTIQPPRTLILDIGASEEDILKRMNQSTRRKVKFRDKMQIDVRQGNRADLDSFTRLMSITGDRDTFHTYPPDYYRRVFDIFYGGDRCALLMASFEGNDLAGLMVFRCGQQAYYLYGASSNEERNRMPTYILQLEAIRWAKRHNCVYYDMWGVPDAEEADLEAQFQTRGDGLWGVYGFKRGFGGQIRRSVGAWDKVYNPILYAAYWWYAAR